MHWESEPFVTAEIYKYVPKYAFEVEYNPSAHVFLLKYFLLQLSSVKRSNFNAITSIRKQFIFAGAFI